MRRKIGVQCRQLPDTPTFKLLVISGGADAERNVRAQLLRQRAAGICAGLCQKLLVLQGTALGLYVVQRILERYLRVRARTYILRHSGLYRLEVQKIQRVAQQPQEIADGGLVEVCSLILQRVFDLPQLLVPRDVGTVQQLVKAGHSLLVVGDLFLERQTVEIKH